MLLVGLVIVAVGVIGGVLLSFQLWRAMGGASSGQSIGQMDRSAMPAGLRVAARVAFLAVPVGAIVAVIGAVR